MSSKAIFPLLMIVSALAYLPLLSAPPVFDDRLAVLENPSARELPEALRSLAQAPPHRGLTNLSFALNRLLTGDSPACLRLGSLLLHLGAAAAAWALAHRLGLSGSWAGAWLALHPLAVFAAGYLAQRAAVLEALLAFLCLSLYLRARETGSRPAYAGALGAAALAMGAKETAVTLPLSLAVLEWILPAKERRLIRWLPFSALLVAAVWRGDGIPAGQMPVVGSALTAPEYLRAQPAVLGLYLLKASLPFPLQFLHDREAGGFVLTALALLAAIAWVLLGPERHRSGRLGLGLLLAPLALEALLPLPDIAFYHRLYPGLLGGALLFSWAAERLPRFLVIAILGCLALGAWGEARTRSSPPALTARDVRGAFRSDVPWGNHGWELLRRGEVASALRLFEQGLRAPWGELRLQLGRAQALMMLGRRAEAGRELGRIAKGLREAGRLGEEPELARWLEAAQAWAAGGPGSPSGEPSAP